MSMELNKESVEQAGGDERAAFEAWSGDRFMQDTIHNRTVFGAGYRAALAQPSPVPVGNIELARTLFEEMALIADDEKCIHMLAGALAQASPALPPFAEKVLDKLRRFYDCASDFESGGVDIGRHWLDLLTQLGLLNRVQRSPAFWEISQQGEDLLGMPQPSPAQAEAERPEVVAYLFVKPDGTLSMDAVRHKPSQPAVSVMTVAQHERIVGDLRADRDSWAEQAEQRLADWDEMRKERDAALARVEQQERTIAGMNEAHAKLAGLYEAAQAQHSVPDDDMILQIFADNAEHSEQGDEHGYCIVREQHAQAIARKLLAAAPGNSAQHSVPEGWKLVPIEPLLNMMSDKDHDTRITAERQLLSILADVPGNLVPQAWLDVQAERRRQITAEGWTPEHDDEHSHGQMARAAACYALAGSSAPNDGTAALLVSLAWPWDEQWWKPTTTRRDLVKACALGLAEIERLDRAAAPGKEVGHE
ncbi:hypothetical protein [Pseudomonas aeruginosa]|uniref:hypothetical protein n=1 Tax=Pseudomonas aeruginosa TaxID=287 RepID=UPI000A864E17|nr:hypothetical protein [Pseudomonas aeruginosa]